MPSYFILSSDESGSRRLLSYSGSVKNGKLLLTLRVEVEEDLSYVLKELEAILRSSAKPKPAKPNLTKPQANAVKRVLGLPSPDDFKA